MIAAGLAFILAGVTTPPAQADDDEELALRAQEVHSQLCAGIGSAGVSNAAASLSLLSETWGQVSEAYESNQRDFLLYWRGLLGQCLGQMDLAKQDLLDFVSTTADSRALLPLARDARTRLRRMGVQVPSSSRANRKAGQNGSGKGDAASSAEATTLQATRLLPGQRWGRRVHVGVGAGYQRTADWNYLAVGADVSVRIVGPLGIMVLARPGFSELVTPRPSLLFAFGIGPVIRIPGKVSPLFGAALQLAPNPGGGTGANFLVGGVGIGGVEVPLGSSPLAFRVAAEVGGLSEFFCLRVLGGLSLRFG